VAPDERCLQGSGVLAMSWYQLIQNIFLKISFALAVFSCQAQEIDYGHMDSSEKSFNEHQSHQLVAYMSLETMFPDKNVRALAKAAGKGETAIIDALVAKGVDINSRGRSNATPLFWAMHNISGYAKLLELGADSNIVFDDGGTVMHWSVQHENVAFLELALKNGGNPNLVAGQAEETPIFELNRMSKRNTDLYVLSLLISSGADIDAQTVRGDTPAMVAAGLGRFDLVYKLLDSGANFRVENNNGSTLLGEISAKRNFYISGSTQEKSLQRVISWFLQEEVALQ